MNSHARNVRAVAPVSTLTAAEKDELFGCILRSSVLFNQALARCNPERFEAHELEYVCILKVCRELQLSARLTPDDDGFAQALRTRLHDLAGRDSQGQAVAKALERFLKSGGLLDRLASEAAEETNERQGRQLLRRLLLEQQIWKPLAKLFGECQGADLPADPGALINELNRRRESIDSVLVSDIRCFGDRDEWDEHEAQLEELRTHEFLGFRTGLAQFDWRTRGLRGLTVFSAAPGVGKTTFAAVELALGVCRHHAENDAAVLVLSLDMPRFDLYTRLKCNLGGIDFEDLTAGPPSGDPRRRDPADESLREAQELAKRRREEDQLDRRLLILDQAAMSGACSATLLRSVMDRLKKKSGASRVLLVVDYLQLLPVPARVGARGEHAADRYRIRQIQKVIGCSRTSEDPLGDAAVVISEARKPGASAKVWGGSVADLMGTARVGYAADMVLLCRPASDTDLVEHFNHGYRDDDVRRRYASRRVAPLVMTIAKGRDGVTRGEWPLEFHHGRSIFQEITTGADEDSWSATSRGSGLLTTGRDGPSRRFGPLVPDSEIEGSRRPGRRRGLRAPEGGGHA